MHGILATFNEYQSHESGADIAYKMGQKARNGDTIGRAPLGYLNYIDRANRSEIRTVVIDPERASLVQLGFKLFAAGNSTGRMIIQHTVTLRRDEYTYFFCRNRLSQQQIVKALATLTVGDTAENGCGRPVDPVQVYWDSNDDQRRLLNHSLFRRLYLAEDRIINPRTVANDALT